MIDKNDPKYSHYPHIGNSSQTPSDAPKNDEEQKANTDTTIGQNPVETNSEHNTERVANDNTVAHNANDAAQNPEPRRQSSFWSAMFLINLSAKTAVLDGGYSVWPRLNRKATFLFKRCSVSDAV